MPHSSPLRNVISVFSFCSVISSCPSFSRGNSFIVGCSSVPSSLISLSQSSSLCLSLRLCLWHSVVPFLSFFCSPFLSCTQLRNATSTWMVSDAFLMHYCINNDTWWYKSIKVPSVKICANTNFVSACHVCALFFCPVKKSHGLLKKNTTLF